MVETVLSHQLRFGDLGVTVHYQPVIDIETGDVSGAEAVLRGGVALRRVPTATLVRMLRDDDFPILDFVLHRITLDRELCRRVSPDLWCATGLDPLDLDLGRLDTLTRVADRLGPALALSVRVDDVIQPDVWAWLVSLAASGVRLIVDEVTGTKEQAALVDLVEPAMVRLHPTVASQAGAGGDLQQVARLVAELPRTTAVIATGVERTGHVRFLRELGCTHAQGYLFSRPVPPETLMAMLLSGPNG